MRNVEDIGNIFSKYIEFVDFIECPDDQQFLNIGYSYRPDAFGENYLGFLKNNKVSFPPTHKKIASSLSKVTKILNKSFLFLHQLLKRHQKQSTPVYPKGTIFLTCQIQKTRNRDESSSIQDFINRRSDFIQRSKDKNLKIIVFLYYPDPISTTNISRIEKKLAETLDCQILKIDCSHLVFFTRLYLLWDAFYSICKNNLKIIFTSKKLLSIKEKKFLSRSLFKSLYSFYYSRCLQTLLTNRFSFSKCYFVTSYSFLRYERIFISAIQNAGGVAIDFAPRVYTSLRPSNCTNVFRKDSLNNSLPKYFVVPCLTSRNCLVEQGANKENIWIAKKKTPQTIENFPSFDHTSSAVLVYLQRENDNPLLLLQNLKKRSEIKTIYCKPHPRFPKVRAILEREFGDSSLVFVENEFEIQENVLFSVSVFSSAALRACRNNIPVIWTPFLHIDSLIVMDSLQQEGLVTNSWDEFHEALSARTYLDIFKQRKKENDSVQQTFKSKGQNKIIESIISSCSYG
ncbi:MAG: hypothetical protein LAT58_00955 [Opitutales bacterium]|nr:hypothetical protein [Opitutales bacterium]